MMMFGGFLVARAAATRCEGAAATKARTSIIGPELRDMRVYSALGKLQISPAAGHHGALRGIRNCTRRSMAFGSVTCDDSNSEPSQRNGVWGHPRPRIGGPPMSCGLWFGLVVFGFLPDPPTPAASQPTSLRGDVVDADSGRPIPCRV